MAMVAEESLSFQKHAVYLRSNPRKHQLEAYGSETVPCQDLCYCEPQGLNPVGTT